MTSEHEALQRRYDRLRISAQRVVEEAEAIGNREQPMAGITPYLLRNLRRELSGEPQPSGMWMSVSGWRGRMPELWAGHTAGPGPGATSLN